MPSRSASFGIGLAVPGKAVGKYWHPSHLPIPFAPKHGARPEVRSTPAQIHGTLSRVFRRRRAIEQTLTLAIQVTKLSGLKAVSQNAKQEMSGQVRGHSMPQYGVPTGPKLTDVEITQARNLDVLALGIQGVELEIEVMLGRLAGVDRTAKHLPFGSLHDCRRAGSGDLVPFRREPGSAAGLLVPAGSFLTSVDPFAAVRVCAEPVTLGARRPPAAH